MQRDTIFFENFINFAVPKKLENHFFPNWKQQKNHLSQPKTFPKTKNWGEKFRNFLKVSGKSQCRKPWGVLYARKTFRFLFAKQNSDIACWGRENLISRLLQNITKLKGDPWETRLWKTSTSILLQNSKKIEGRVVTSGVSKKNRRKAMTIVGSFQEKHWLKKSQEQK